jgi:hypothetical protein
MDTNQSTKKYPIVSALVDLGTAWASHGLDAGKLSLQNSAKMLTRTAETLESLARELDKKGHHTTPTSTP